MYRAWGITRRVCVDECGTVLSLFRIIPFREVRSVHGGDRRARPRRALARMFLASVLVGASAAAGLLSDSPDLLECQRRRTSNARAAFAAAVQNPLLKDPRQHNPIELISLIVAEERCTDPTLQMPSDVAASLKSRIEQISTPASKRIALTRALGADAGSSEASSTATMAVSSESIARAVATTLFGSPGAPDDDTSDDNGFFLSESHEPFNVYEDALLQYYNPERLYLDTVLSNRRGVPLATSLIALEACSQLGLHMVGLRSPTALLLAPADGTPFLLDCFRGGVVMDDDSAAAALAERLAPGVGAVLQSGDEQRGKLVIKAGKAQLAAMRAAPMTSLQWGAEMLRMLREMHEEEGDVVRLLGACDRLRMIGAHSRLAVSNEEMRECAGQLALCIFKLGWTQRRNEARMLLKGVLRSHAEMGTDPDEPRRVEELLEQPWFNEV